MTIARAVFAQVAELMRPLAVKISNVVARVQISGVNDTTKWQEVQVEGLPGETLDEVERPQNYGFSSCPLPGAEGVALFVDGDRGHPLVIAVDDRRYRPVGGEPGDVNLYHFEGARILLRANGDIVVSAKPGGKVLIDDGSGGTSPPALLSDVVALRSWVYDQFGVAKGHIHAVAGLVTTTITTAVPFSAPAPSVPPTPVGATNVEVK